MKFLYLIFRRLFEDHVTEPKNKSPKSETRYVHGINHDINSY